MSLVGWRERPPDHEPMKKSALLTLAEWRVNHMAHGGIDDRAADATETYLVCRCGAGFLARN